VPSPVSLAEAPSLSRSVTRSAGRCVQLSYISLGHLSLKPLPTSSVIPHAELRTMGYYSCDMWWLTKNHDGVSLIISDIANFRNIFRRVFGVPRSDIMFRLFLVHKIKCVATPPVKTLTTYLHLYTFEILRVVHVCDVYDM